MNAFGPTAWAARSASIVSASMGVGILYLTTREWLGDRIARSAALVLATQPLFFGAAQFANLDMLVASCIAATILSGARAALRFEDERPEPLWFYVPVLFVLTLPCPVCVLSTCPRRRSRRHRPRRAGPATTLDQQPLAGLVLLDVCTSRHACASAANARPRLGGVVFANPPRVFAGRAGHAAIVVLTCDPALPILGRFFPIEALHAWARRYGFDLDTGHTGSKGIAC